MKSWKATFRAVARSYRGSLKIFWPGFGKRNDLNERNNTFHLAKQLERQGFKCYFEVTYKAKGKRSPTRQVLDLVAIHPHEGIAIFAETKKLWAKGKLSGIRTDVSKTRQAARSILEEIVEDKEDRYAGADIRQLWGVVMANTWVEGFWTQWRSKGPHRGGAGKLFTTLDNLNAIRGIERVVGEAEGYPEKMEGPMHLLWAVYRL